MLLINGLPFSDDNIQVSIKGDLNQAKVEFYANQKKKNSGNGLEEQDEDIGNDVDEDEEKGIFS